MNLYELTEQDKKNLTRLLKFLYGEGLVSLVYHELNRRPEIFLEYLIRENSEATDKAAEKLIRGYLERYMIREELVKGYDSRYKVIRMYYVRRGFNLITTDGIRWRYDLRSKKNKKTTGFAMTRKYMV